IPWRGCAPTLNRPGCGTPRSRRNWNAKSRHGWRRRLPPPWRRRCRPRTSCLTICSRRIRPYWRPNGANTRQTRWRITAMAEKTLLEAIQDGMAVALAEDDRILILGEDVGRNGGVFRATD